MIGGAQCQEIEITGVGAGHDHGEVDGFRARIGEVHHPFMAPGHGGGEFLGKVRGHRMVEHGGAVGELLGLRHRRVDDGGVGVAHRDADIHAEKVGVFLAVNIPEILHRALAEHEGILEGHELAL